MNRDDINLWADIVGLKKGQHWNKANLNADRMAAFARLAARLAANEERAACLEIIATAERKKWHAVMHGGEMTGASLIDVYTAIRARGDK